MNLFIILKEIANEEWLSSKVRAELFMRIFESLLEKAVKKQEGGKKTYC